MRRLYTWGVVALVTAAWLAGPGPVVAGGDPPLRTAAGIRAGLIYGAGSPLYGMAYRESGRMRSVPMAFGLSAVVPGLGQAYNRQWVKAGIGLAVEALLVAGYVNWHSQGIDGRDAYQVYAHTFWSPVQYADWLNDYSTWLEQDFDPTLDVPRVEVTDALRGIDYQHPGGWTSEQTAAVRSLFDEIRRAENHVVHPETGASFSHKLPYFGDQQYYELIGKYFQFAPGWSDYGAWITDDGTFTEAIDPERTGPGGSKPNVSTRFLDYADDHGTANDYLRRASRVSLLFVFNHLLAAVDAAVFARIHNNRLQTTVGLSQNVLGELEPVASMRFSF
jgi:hypothetical protein